MIKVRRKWKIKPKTKVKPSAKIYKRSNKKVIQHESD